VATQRELAAQMLAQLRALDPSVSAEVGTPERKILDTVAEALADAQVDLTALAQALNIDNKFGTNLDRFLTLFGFSRQRATRATGYVTFGRTSAGTQDIIIPAASELIAPGIITPDGLIADNFYRTLFSVTLPAGATQTSAVPVEAVMAGSIGNIAAQKVQDFSGTPVYGITLVTQEAPISGGIDEEDDNTFKVRFRNTVFRNLAGTQDQYLGMVASTAFSTKANVVGSVSRYREYIQVPSQPDSNNGNSQSATDYTSALSSIPYSKYIYPDMTNFISNGQTGASALFYRENTDWEMNIFPPSKYRGDTFRLATTTPPSAFNPLSDEETLYQPNVTFLNVYTGDDETVQLPRPGDVLLFEHSYLSSASRNDIYRNVTNSVDVYVNGSNDTVASAVIPAPGLAPAAVFSNSGAFDVANYRRFGYPTVNPTANNVFTPLFWQPVIDLPISISITGNTALGMQTAVFNRDEHYYLVEETAELFGSVRARNGIEWDVNVRGYITNNNAGAPSGPYITEFLPGTSIGVDNYTFDKNIVDLQAALESEKQVTTDVLIHRARLRYFKLDITVMYSPGANPAGVNDDIRLALESYLNGFYFGNAIQLSDLLQTIHNVPGVDNVRWSADVPTSGNWTYTTADEEIQKRRIVETDRFGAPLPTGQVDRFGLPLNPYIKSDFFLADDELPSLPIQQIAGDTLQGLIIRERAQNTWTRTV
jgi:uncharacterized phage protein gp47/JayE